MVASEDDDEVNPAFWEDVAGVVVENYASFRGRGRGFVVEGREERIQGVEKLAGEGKGVSVDVKECGEWVWVQLMGSRGRGGARGTGKGGKEGAR